MSDWTPSTKTPLPLVIADIGATNARFSMISPSGCERTAQLRCADHSSLESATRAFLAEIKAPPGLKRGAFAVAAPVVGDQVTLTNLSWHFSSRALRDALGFERLDIINDFAAVALAIPHLGAGDRRQIGEGSPEPKAPIAILGPGSGLGVSGLLPVGTGWTVLSGEGGHVTLPATDDLDSAVLGILRRRFDHVSAEQVLSGPGLVNLYLALNDLEGQLPQPMTAAEITTAALAGTQPLCRAALTLFAAWLGTVAGNLALTLGARGGVYIAGGIVPRLIDFLATSPFRQRFIDKGKQGRYLAPIPTYVITPPPAGLRRPQGSLLMTTAAPSPPLPRVAYQLPTLPGRGRLLALVGEAPGREEVIAGQPFVGRSGRLLDDHLRTAGIERRACLVANVFRVQPPDNKVGHFFSSRAKARRQDTPLAECWGRFGSSDYCLAAFSGEIDALAETLERLRPAVIVALGRTPLWALTGLGGILDCRGTTQPCRLLAGATVVPTYHPSYLLRGNRSQEPLFQADLSLAARMAAEG